MAAFSWIVVASIGTLLTPASCRTFRKDLEIALDLLRRDHFLYSNEVDLFDYVRGDKPKYGLGRKGLVALPSTKNCPRATETKTNPSFDFYHIGDFRFSIPTRTANGMRKRKVLAECGFLLGLSDFKKIMASEGSGLWLKWENLRAKCQLSTVIDGLKDSTGQTDVLVEPLLMLVYREASVHQKSPEVEMTRSKEADIKIHGLSTLSNEQQDKIGIQLESRITCVVNSYVRNVLRDYVKTSFRNRNESFMSKLNVTREI